MKNRVSVIIPTYNRAKLIGKTLESVIVQTHQNWECIIVDDDSTDHIKKVLSIFLEKDSRIKYFRRPKSRPKGASSCRNFGVEKATGEFIQFLDSDDLISPTKLEQQLLVLKNRPSMIACCSWELFREDPQKDGLTMNLSYENGVYEPCDFLKSMGVRNTFFPPHTYIVPRKIIEKSGGWNETLTNNDDAEFFSRVILVSSGISYATSCTAYYRKSGPDHLSNYSNINRVKSAIKSWELIENHLQEQCHEDALIYVHNAKHWLFQTIKNKFPYTISKQRSFFHIQFEKEPERLKFYFIALKVLKKNLGEIKRNFLYKKQ